MGIYLEFKSRALSRGIGILFLHIIKIIEPLWYKTKVNYWKQSPYLEQISILKLGKKSWNTQYKIL